MICHVCEIDFDPRSRAKREAGGLATHCPDCSSETTPRAVGVTSGDGKQASVTIVRPSTNEDRRAFLNYWQRATGLHRGKSCQMDARLTTPAFNVAVVHQSESTNHKGKA
jgi:hypothetical protein